jgi:hypothetical protein
MEQNTTENQIEDTSGLRGLKLIKTYLSKLLRNDPEMELTTFQRRFLIGISFIMMLVTFVLVPFLLKSYGSEALPSGEVDDPTIIFEACLGLFVYLFALFIPSCIFYGSLVLHPLMVSISESRLGRYFVVPFGFCLLMGQLDMRLGELFLGIYMTGFTFVAWKVGTQTETLIAIVEKFESLLGERLNKVFGIKS